MRYFISIDPGSSGSMCALSDSGEVHFKDFKDEDLKGYITWIQDVISIHGSPTMVAIEKVHAMPGQGVTSMFSFGQRLGELEGMLQTLNLGYELVPPKTWQKPCGIVMPKKATPALKKKTTYTTISKLYPDAPLTGPKGGIIDGRCDALGIAHHLRIKY